LNDTYKVESGVTRIVSHLGDDPGDVISDLPDGDVDLSWQPRSAPRLRHTRFLAPVMARVIQKWVARERVKEAPRNTRERVKGGAGTRPFDGLFCSG